MSDYAIGLDEFFDPADLAPARLVALILAHHDKTARQKEEERDPAAARLPWPEAVRRSAPKVKDLQRIDVPAIAQAAWEAYQTFKAYTDPAQYPEQTTSVDLLQHTITSKQKPSIEIVLDGERVREITFELDLSLVLTASVVLSAGKIVEITFAESCQGEGSLKWQGLPLAKRETKPLGLRQVILSKDSHLHGA